jgi:hypothetical protein
MLNRVHHLDGSAVTAADGLIGHVKDVFFDDVRWTIRYLVVDTGHWLPGREVLISPYAIKPLVATAKNVDLRLTRQQVTDSPDVDTHMPVSRQHEGELVAYYGYPNYWGAGGLWGMGGYPYFPVALPTAEEVAADNAARAARASSADGALRSAALSATRSTRSTAASATSRISSSTTRPGPSATSWSRPATGGRVAPACSSHRTGSTRSTGTSKACA